MLHIVWNWKFKTVAFEDFEFRWLQKKLYLLKSVISIYMEGSCTNPWSSSAQTFTSLQLPPEGHVFQLETEKRTVCVVRNAPDPWGRQRCLQAVSRDAVVPSRSCRHGAVTIGALWLWRLAQGISHPYNPIFIQSFPPSWPPNGEKDNMETLRATTSYVFFLKLLLIH